MRKRILMITPDLGYGGAEKSFSRWADMLSAHHDVTRVVFNTAEENVYLKNRDLVSLDIPGGKNLFSKLWYFFKRVVRLKQIKGDLRPDVSISFLEGADYVNVLSKQSDKVVLSIRGSKLHDTNISGLLGWIRHRILIPQLYNRANLITVVSEGIKKELQEFYKINKRIPIKVIHNFYNVQELQQLASEPLPVEWKDFLNSHEVMICVGRLARQKGYPFMIRVFKRMKVVKPDLKLLILGAGDDVHVKLVKQAEDMSLGTFSQPEALTNEKDIYFAGFINNPHAFVAHATLFVLPSRVEGFPNALVEAMAIGIPVAAANCLHGPAEIFGQPIDTIQKPLFLNCGLLLPATEEQINDPLEEHWAEALIKALDDVSWRKFAIDGATQRVANFTLQKFQNSWEDLLA